MARGQPRQVSLLVGTPFAIIGLYFYVINTDFPSEVGLPFLLFGSFVITVGLYVHYIASPDEPSLRESESVVATQHPTQRIALAEIVLAIPFGIISTYLLLFTVAPYVYPTITFLIGLYFLSSGLRTYWINSLTTYYVTNRRVISQYRFMTLVRKEISLSKIRGIEERRSITEALVGLGNIRIASGGGTPLEINMRSMKQPTEFADELRSLV